MGEDRRQAVNEAPGPDFVGQTEITVTVLENRLGGQSASTTFNLSVSNTNDAPILAPIGDQATGESQALELPIIFTDADEGDTHSVMVTSSDDRVGIEGEGNISGSAYRFVPVAGFLGRARITVTITDDGEEPLQDSESFWVTITNEAQAPIVEPIADAIGIR